MGEGLSHWSNMVLRKSQTYFFDRHTHPNSMYSNFCHVLKILLKDSSMRKEMAKNSRLRYERYYTSEIFSSCMQEFYNRFVL